MSDGNVQDISVFDKEVAALPATQEGQDMSRLAPIIVPPPSYTDPNNPKAATGSINMSLEDHPLDISEDFGADLGAAHATQSPMDASVTEAGEDTKTPFASAGAEVEYPEDREDWTVAHYKARLRELGEPTSGNKDELIDRLDEAES